MNTIERLKKYMEEEKLTLHNISMGLNLPVQTIHRWVKTGRINVMYEKNLNEWLVLKGR